MKITNRLIYYLLCAYIILTPIIPGLSNFTWSAKIPKVESFGNMLLGLLIAVFLITIIKNWNDFIINVHDFLTDPLGISMAALFAIMAISISYASYKEIALSESTRFLSFILLYFIIKYTVDKNRVRGFINSYMFTFALINIYGIFQKFTGFGLFASYGVAGTNVLRTTATFGNPNTFAAFLLLGTFPTLMMIIKSKNIGSKAIFTILFIMTLCNISFTYSRNSFLALALGGLLLSLIYSWYFLIGLGGLVVSAFIIPSIRTRLSQIGNKYIDDGRIYIWKTALKMIKEHPILGVGNGNFIKLYDTYVSKYKYLRYLDYSGYPSHNSYLKIESELGIVGGLSFIGIIVGSIIKLRNVIKLLEDKDLRLFFIGFFASVIGFLFMNFFENLFTVPEVAAYFWIFLASADGIIMIKKSPSNKFIVD